MEEDKYCHLSERLREEKLMLHVMHNVSQRKNSLKASRRRIRQSREFKATQQLKKEIQRLLFPSLYKDMLQREEKLCKSTICVYSYKLVERT